MCFFPQDFNFAIALLPGPHFFKNKKSAFNFIVVLVHTGQFYLDVFKIISLSFNSFNHDMVGMGLFIFILLFY